LPNAPSIKRELGGSAHLQLAAQRSAGRAILEADRAKINRTTTAQIRTITSKDLGNAATHKLDLAPLSPPPATKPANCERTRRIEALQKEAANETDPAKRERALLVQAGYHVGQGDWQAAKAILDGLAATSRDPIMQETVRRNLEVVNRQLAVLMEQSPVRREQLELDLAQLHADLGHEQAAKRIHRQLANTATDPVVRQTAARFLKEPPNPTQLPVLPRLKRPLEDPPAGAPKTGAAR
jgi:hypothetical protein